MSSFLGQPAFEPCKKQMTLSAIMKSCVFFGVNEPTTYEYYLRVNTSLSEGEREYYRKVIHFLKEQRAEERAELFERTRPCDVVMGDHGA